TRAAADSAAPPGASCRSRSATRHPSRLTISARRYCAPVALQERMAAVAPLSGRDRQVAVALVAALVLVTIGVVLGAFTRLDQYALDHWMRWLKPRAKPAVGHDGLWQPFHLHAANGLKLLELVTYPCSVLISGLIVVIAAVVLWPRLGPLAALAPAAAWVV